MSNLKSFITTSALLTLLSSVNAGPLVERNQNPALPSCSSNFDAWTYSGCFTDPSSPRALLYDSGLNTQNMTVEICIAFCKGNDYRYAGLEYYGECFCGASVNGVQVNETECTFPCTGNSSQTCGGNDLLNIYQDPTFPLVNDTTIADYQSLGCYSESTTGRALAWRQDQVPAATMTVEACLYACKQGGYDFAGVEYAQECYCGVVIGNGTAKIDDSLCNMACNGNPSEICGGSGTLNMYVASDLESTEPCNIVSIPSSPSTVSSTTTSSTSSSTSSSSTTTSSSSSSSTTSSSSWTSTTTTSSSTSSTTSSSTSSTTSSSTSSTTSSSISSTTSSRTSSTTSSPTSSTTSSSKPCTTTTSSSTSTSSATSTTTSSTASTTSIRSTLTTSKTSASLCTTTIVTSPTPTCEYSCGNWCSAPMPNFNDNPSCSIAANWLGLQVATCFLQAGWPASLQCFDYAGWASNVKGYCTSTCASGTCSRNNCKSQYPPSGPPAPPGTTSVSVYTCAAAAAATTSSTRMSTSSRSTTTTSVPVPTNTNICTQPSNSRYGYSPGSPVGSINMPCLTCNNLLSDYNAGNVFKLYTSPNSNLCPSYQKTSCISACQNSCDQQYAACKSTYANSCSSNSVWSIIFDGADSYSSAMTKCTQQWNDCYTVNQGVSAGTRCGSWNSGWY